MNNNSVYILNINRTPIGSILGNLKDHTAADLAVLCINSLFDKELINLKKEIDTVIIGNVISSGLGLNLANEIALKSNLNINNVNTVINRACASGMDAIIMAYNLIKYENKDIIIAGGTESMSNAPYLNKHIRKNNKYGNIELLDSIISDGLSEPIDKQLMGKVADDYCINNNITITEQTEYAINSYEKSINNNNNNEIIDIKINNNIINTDEEKFKLNKDKIKNLKPIFNKNGSITAGNASKLSDGASIAILISEKKMLEIKNKYNINPLCKIIDTNIIGGDIASFVEAPSHSISNILIKNNLNIDTIDLFEINEAFSCVPIICSKNLNIDYNKININGGAVSLGHPLGCSGCRILCTLIHNLINKNKKTGIASICVGSGGASSILLEII